MVRALWAALTLAGLPAPSSGRTGTVRRRWRCAAARCRGLPAGSAAAQLLARAWRGRLEQRAAMTAHRSRRGSSWRRRRAGRRRCSLCSFFSFSFYPPPASRSIIILSGRASGSAHREEDGDSVWTGLFWSNSKLRAHKTHIHADTRGTRRSLSNRCYVMSPYALLFLSLCFYFFCCPIQAYSQNITKIKHRILCMQIANIIISRLNLFIYSTFVWKHKAPIIRSDEICFQVDHQYPYGKVALNTHLQLQRGRSACAHLTHPRLEVGWKKRSVEAGEQVSFQVERHDSWMISFSFFKRAKGDSHWQLIITQLTQIN